MTVGARETKRKTNFPLPPSAPRVSLPAAERDNRKTISQQVSVIFLGPLIYSYTRAPSRKAALSCSGTASPYLSRGSISSPEESLQQRPVDALCTLKE